MAKSKKPARNGTASPATEGHQRYCAARFPKPRKLSRGLEPGRARLIRENEFKWMNGSTLRYWFFDKPSRWVGAEDQKKVVRKAFGLWKQLGVGLNFVEVASRSEADIRIAFEQGDGAWSYIGTDVRAKRSDARTMNFGWSLTDDPQDGLDTAIHEIGHTLGFPHEHQNPFAGIVWDEDAVYTALAAPPNEWSRSVTFHNIIEKILPDSVQGSRWDPDSVMHYPFERGLIQEPAKYRNGLRPAGGLSGGDREWALKFYPGVGKPAQQVLVPFQSVSLTLGAGEQVSFAFSPPETRVYEFRTFGTADTVMALFDATTKSNTALAQDDDSGTDRNAYFKLKLSAGQKCTLRVRLYYAKAKGQTAVMAW